MRIYNTTKFILIQALIAILSTYIFALSVAQSQFIPNERRYSGDQYTYFNCSAPAQNAPKFFFEVDGGHTVATTSTGRPARVRVDSPAPAGGYTVTIQTYRNLLTLSSNTVFIPAGRLYSNEVLLTNFIAQQSPSSNNLLPELITLWVGSRKCEYFMVHIVDYNDPRRFSPPAPIGLRIAEQAPTSFTVTWDPLPPNYVFVDPYNRNAPPRRPLGFCVGYGVGNSSFDSLTQDVCCFPNNSYTFSGMTVGRSYDVYIRFQEQCTSCYLPKTNFTRYADVKPAVVDLYDGGYYGSSEDLISCGRRFITASPSPTPTLRPTQTITPAPTVTPSPTATPAPTSTSTATSTATPSPSPTPPIFSVDCSTLTRRIPLGNSHYLEYDLNKNYVIREHLVTQQHDNSIISSAVPISPCCEDHPFAVHSKLNFKNCDPSGDVEMTLEIQDMQTGAITSSLLFQRTTRPEFIINYWRDTRPCPGNDLRGFSNVSNAQSIVVVPDPTSTTGQDYLVFFLLVAGNKWEIHMAEITRGPLGYTLQNARPMTDSALVTLPPSALSPARGVLTSFALSAHRNVNGEFVILAHGARDRCPTPNCDLSQVGQDANKIYTWVIPNNSNTPVLRSRVDFTDYVYPHNILVSPNCRDFVYSNASEEIAACTHYIDPSSGISAPLSCGNNFTPFTVYRGSLNNNIPARSNPSQLKWPLGASHAYSKSGTFLISGNWEEPFFNIYNETTHNVYIDEDSPIIWNYGNISVDTNSIVRMPTGDIIWWVRLTGTIANNLGHRVMIMSDPELGIPTFTQFTGFNESLLPTFPAVYFRIPRIGPDADCGSAYPCPRVPTPTPTATQSPTPTASQTPTPSPSPTAVVTQSPTPVATSTSTPNPTITATPAPSPSPTPVVFNVDCSSPVKRIPLANSHFLEYYDDGNYAILAHANRQMHDPSIISTAVATSPCCKDHPFAAHLRMDFGDCDPSGKVDMWLEIQDMRTGAITSSRRFARTAFPEEVLDFWKPGDRCPGSDLRGFSMNSNSQGVIIVPNPAGTSGEDYLVFFLLVQNNKWETWYAHVTRSATGYGLNTIERMTNWPMANFPQNAMTQDFGVLTSFALSAHRNVNGEIVILAHGARERCQGLDCDLSALGEEARHLYTWVIPNNSSNPELRHRTEMPHNSYPQNILVSPNCSDYVFSNGDEGVTVCDWVFNPQTRTHKQLSCPNSFLNNHIYLGNIINNQPTIPTVVRLNYPLGASHAFSASGTYLASGNWEEPPINIYNMNQKQVFIDEFNNYSQLFRNVRSDFLSDTDGIVRLPTGDILWGAILFSTFGDLVSILSDPDTNSPYFYELTGFDKSLIPGNGVHKIRIPRIGPDADCGPDYPCNTDPSPTATPAPSFSPTPGNTATSSPSPSSSPPPSVTFRNTAALDCDNPANAFEITICLNSSTSLDTYTGQILRVTQTRTITGGANDPVVELTNQVSVEYLTATNCFKVSVPRSVHPDGETFVYQFHWFPEGGELDGTASRVSSSLRIITSCRSRPECPRITSFEGFPCESAGGAFTFRTRLSAPIGQQNCPEGIFVIQFRNTPAEAWRDIIYPYEVFDPATGSYLTTLDSDRNQIGTREYRVVLRPAGLEDVANQIPFDQIVRIDPCPQVALECPLQITIERICRTPDRPTFENVWRVRLIKPNGDATCTGDLVLYYRKTFPDVTRWNILPNTPISLANAFGASDVYTYDFPAPLDSNVVQIAAVRYPQGLSNPVNPSTVYEQSFYPCGEGCCVTHTTNRGWGVEPSLTTWSSTPFQLDMTNNLSRGSSDFYYLLTPLDNVLEYKTSEDILINSKLSIPTNQLGWDGMAIPPGIRVQIWDGDNLDDPASGNNLIIDVTGPLLIANTASLDQVPSYRQDFYSMNFDFPNAVSPFNEFLYPRNSAFRTESKSVVNATSTLPVALRQNYYDMFSWVVRGNSILTTPRRSMRITRVGDCDDRLKVVCPVRIIPKCPHTACDLNTITSCQECCANPNFVALSIIGKRSTDSKFYNCTKITVSFPLSCHSAFCVKTCQTCYSATIEEAMPDGSYRIAKFIKLPFDESFQTDNYAEMLQNDITIKRTDLQSIGTGDFRVVLKSHKCAELDSLGQNAPEILSKTSDTLRFLEDECMDPEKLYLPSENKNFNEFCSPPLIEVLVNKCKDCGFCQIAEIYRKLPNQVDYEPLPLEVVPPGGVLFSSSYVSWFDPRSWQRGEKRRIVMKFFKDCKTDPVTKIVTPGQQYAVRNYDELQRHTCDDPMVYADQLYGPAYQYFCKELFYQLNIRQNLCTSCGFCIRYFVYRQKGNEPARLVSVLRSNPFYSFRNDILAPDERVFIVASTYDGDCESEVPDSRYLLQTTEYDSLNCNY